MLFTITSLVDFLGMGVSLWLALHLLGPGFTSRITLRGFVVSVAFAAFFLASYSSLYKQIAGIVAIRAILLTVSILVWNDLTHRFLPGQDHRRHDWLVSVIYALGFVTIMTLLWNLAAFAGGDSNVMWAARMEGQLPYVVYSLFQLCAGASILYNFYAGVKVAVDLQTRYFVVASLLVISTAGYEVLSTAWPPLPSVIQHTLILISIILLGISLERRQTLKEWRTTLEDFAISASAVLWLSAIYIFIAWQIGLSPIAMILLGALSILTHSTYSLIQEFLSRFRSEDAKAPHQRLREYEHHANLQPKSNELFHTLITSPDPQFIKIVEDGLRNLSDFITLGQSSLPGHLGISGTNQIERGKAVQQKLIQAIEVLRPAQDCPSEPIPHEWYSYMILHDAYRSCIPNHEIMSRLYISEGTFHRTRRAAVRAVAHVLLEMRNSQGN